MSHAYAVESKGPPSAARAQLVRALNASIGEDARRTNLRERR